MMSIASVCHQPLARLASRLGGFFLSRECPQMLMLAANPDVRLPLPLGFTPPHAPMRRRGTGITREILHLLTARHDPQIRPAIVEFGQVHVVNLAFVAALEAEQEAVQTNRLERPSCDFGAPTCVSLLQGPSPLSDKCSVVGINQCVGDYRAVAGVQRHADAIIRAHRTLHRSGVRPGAVPPAHGPLAFNYTSTPQGVAA